MSGFPSMFNGVLSIETQNILRLLSFDGMNIFDYFQASSAENAERCSLEILKIYCDLFHLSYMIS